jgi:hypothetical protein
VDDKQPLPQLSTAEVEARGRQFKDGTSSLAVFCCGAKVLQVDTAQGSATDTTFLQHHFAGRADITYHMCLMLQVRFCLHWGVPVPVPAAQGSGQGNAHTPCCVLCAGAAAAAAQQPR